MLHHIVTIGETNMGRVQHLLCLAFGVLCCLVPRSSEHATVEGFVGGQVTLPCHGVPGDKDVYWYKINSGVLERIIIRIGSGSPIVPPGATGVWEDQISIVNAADLRIHSLDADRDSGRFRCSSPIGPVDVAVRLVILVRLAGVTIRGPQSGVLTMVTLSAGQSIILSCDVTGDPNPAPRYSWKIGDQSLVIGRDTNTYNLIADETMNAKTISCTATNYYSNGTDLSSKKSAVTLNVTYVGPVSITPSSVAVIDGDTIMLTCAANGNPSLIFKWKKSAFLLGTSYLYSKLRVQRSDDGEYECQVSNGVTEQSAKVTVVVYSRIRSAAISESQNGKITISAGKSLTLTCSVTGDPDPSPVYTWRIGNVTLPTSTSVCSLTTNESMHKSTITCTAKNYYSNGTTISSAEASVKLNITFLGEVSIHQSPQTVTENGAFTVQCDTVANPPAGFEWRKEGILLGFFYEYTITRVLRKDVGDYTCNAFNIEGNTTANITILVQYPPDLSVAYNSTSQTLTCTAQGVPDIYTFSPWEQRINRQVIRQLPGTTPEPSSYKFVWSSSMGYGDTGNYTCAVTNGIGQIQRKHTLVQPEVSPVFAETTQISITIRMSIPEGIPVSFYTHPKYTKVEWWKAITNETLQNHKEETDFVTLPVYNKTVIFRGFTSVLTLASLEDKGNYTVRVYNDVNGVSQARELVVYVNITDAPDTGNDNGIVGPTVGAVAGVLVLVILMTALAVWYRRRNAGDKPNNRVQGSLDIGRSETDYEITDLGGNENSTADTVPTYESLRRAPQEAVYHNAEPGQNYEKLQFHLRKERFAEEGLSLPVHPEYQTSPDIPASNYQNTAKNPMSHYENTNESYQDTSHGYYNL